MGETPKERVAEEREPSDAELLETIAEFAEAWDDDTWAPQLRRIARRLSVAPPRNAPFAPPPLPPLERPAREPRTCEAL